jgi:hypothetical protein
VVSHSAPPPRMVRRPAARQTATREAHPTRGFFRTAARLPRRPVPDVPGGGQRSLTR